MLDEIIKEYIELLNMTNTLHELKLKELSNDEGHQQLFKAEDNITCDLIDNDIVFDFQTKGGDNYYKQMPSKLNKEIGNSCGRNNNCHYPHLLTPSFTQQKIDYNVNETSTLKCLFPHCDNGNNCRIDKGEKKLLFSLRTQLKKDKINSSKIKAFINNHQVIAKLTKSHTDLSLMSSKNKRKSIEIDKMKTCISTIWYDVINNESNQNK